MRAGRALAGRIAETWLPERHSPTAGSRGRDFFLSDESKTGSAMHSSAGPLSPLADERDGGAASLHTPRCGYRHAGCSRTWARRDDSQTHTGHSPPLVPATHRHYHAVSDSGARAAGADFLRASPRQSAPLSCQKERKQTSQGPVCVKVPGQLGGANPARPLEPRVRPRRGLGHQKGPRGVKISEDLTGGFSPNLAQLIQPGSYASGPG